MFHMQRQRRLPEEHARFYSAEICLALNFLHEKGTSLLLLRPFPYLGSAQQVFNLHVLRYCASSIFTCFSFMYFRITSLHLCFGLPIFRYPPTSIFHVLLTTPSSVFLSTWPNSLASLIFSLIFSTPAIAYMSSVLIFSILFIPIIIYLHILISVLSSKNSAMNCLIIIVYNMYSVCESNCVELSINLFNIDTHA